jgi:quinol monooxygenase YgiN
VRKDMNDNVYWNLEVSIKPGELDNFKKLVTDMVTSIKASEPNALNYEWSISEDNSVCHIYERYSDSEAVMTHLGNFGEKFAERFMAILDVTQFTVYGNPSNQVKEALSGFNPKFLAPVGGFSK